MPEKTAVLRLPQWLLLGLVMVVLLLHSAWATAAPLSQEDKATQTPGSASPTATATPAAPPTEGQGDPLACPPSIIQGFVFEDLNRDQEKQPNEPGLANVKISLQEQDGTAIPGGSRVTDVLGEFCYETGVVGPGTYRLVQQKIDGFDVTGGQERFVTVTTDGVVVVLYPNVRSAPGQTPIATPTSAGGRATPTVKPTNTPTPTWTPSPTRTATSVPPTATGTVTRTPTATATGTSTPTPTATATLRSLTPIATFITTTPGVLVTTTPFPGSPIPIERLPDTGTGSQLLLLAAVLGLLTAGAGIARRLFFTQT